MRLDAAKWRAWDAMMVRSIRALEAAAWAPESTLPGGLQGEVAIEPAGAVPSVELERS